MGFILMKGRLQDANMNVLPLPDDLQALVVGGDDSFMLVDPGLVNSA